MKRIYSNIIGEVLTNELGAKLVYIYDENIDSIRKNPLLILSNKLEIERMRDYLNKVLEKHYNE